MPSCFDVHEKKKLRTAKTHNPLGVGALWVLVVLIEFNAAKS